METILVEQPVESKYGYHELNAMLNLYGADGKIQFDKDRAAADLYIADHVLNNTITFDDLTQRLTYLVDNEYYEAGLLAQYSKDEIASLHDYAASFNFKFESFLGAFNFYTSYALKTFDGKKYLENFEQRTVMVALLDRKSVV